MAYFESMGMKVYLLPKNQCGYCGNEKAYKCKNSIMLLKDEYNSYRFIKYVNNVAVSVLQIMFINNAFQIANVYTLDNSRQKGYAKQLFYEAKRKLKTHKIYHSTNLSSLGKIYANKVN